MACAGLVMTGAPAQSLTIEIDDVAPDRVERQRAYAEGALPLAGTPDLGQLKQRLAAAGVKHGDEMFIRIFKAESQLELWIRKGGQFTLFATYPICHWAGTVGPKLREGDKQNPEGFYSIGARQLQRIGRWPRSLNLGFPNSYDKALGRTGSYILVHGGCSSVGCYAMTNAVMAEIFALTEEALRLGQSRVQVHVFPFRMSDKNMALHGNSAWGEFWRNLKEGYDAFETTHVPPRIGLCDKRYVVEHAAPGEVGDQGPLALCGASRAAMVESSPQSFADLPPQWPSQQASWPPEDLLSLDQAESRRLAARLLSRQPDWAHHSPRLLQQAARATSSPRLAAAGPQRTPTPICNPGLASCRRYLAISAQIEQKRAHGSSRVASSRAPSHQAARTR